MSKHSEDCYMKDLYICQENPMMTSYNDLISYDYSRLKQISEKNKKIFLEQKESVRLRYAPSQMGFQIKSHNFIDTKTNQPKEMIEITPKFMNANNEPLSSSVFTEIPDIEEKVAIKQRKDDQDQLILISFAEVTKNSKPIFTEKTQMPDLEISAKTDSDRVMPELLETKPFDNKKSQKLSPENIQIDNIGFLNLSSGITETSKTRNKWEVRRQVSMQDTPENTNFLKENTESSFQLKPNDLSIQKNEVIEANLTYRYDDNLDMVHINSSSNSETKMKCFDFRLDPSKLYNLSEIFGDSKKNLANNESKSHNSKNTTHLYKKVQKCIPDENLDKISNKQCYIQTSDFDKRTFDSKQFKDPVKVEMVSCLKSKLKKWKDRMKTSRYRKISSRDITPNTSSFLNLSKDISITPENSSMENRYNKTSRPVLRSKNLNYELDVKNSTYDDIRKVKKISINKKENITPKNRVKSKKETHYTNADNSTNLPTSTPNYNKTTGFSPFDLKICSKQVEITKRSSIRLKENIKKRIDENMHKNDSKLL